MAITFGTLTLITIAGTSFCIAVTVNDGWDDVALWAEEGWPKIEADLKAWWEEFELLFKEAEDYRFGNDPNFVPALRTDANEYKIDRSKELSKIGTTSMIKKVTPNW